MLNSYYFSDTKTDTLLLKKSNIEIFYELYNMLIMVIFFNKIFLFLIFFFISGCAIPGAPIGWGGSHKITMSNEKAITFIFDPLVVCYECMVKEATNHCQKYQKSPVPTMTTSSGIIREKVYECK